MSESNWVIAAGCATTYVFYVSINRYRHWRRIDDDAVKVDTLDSAHKVLTIFQQFEFPLIIRKSLEFGLFRTYGIPSISTILVGSKELTDRCARRYDDTDFLITEFTEQHPQSLRAETAIRRMNFIHGHYKSITNADFLYVLAVFMIEPIRWVNKYGYRKVHWKESRALFMIYRDVGMKMGLQNVFNSEAAAERYYDEYEEKHMLYQPSNGAVAVSTMELFLSLVPSALHPLGRSIVYSLCDKRLRVAMGFPDPPLWASLLSCTALSVSGWITRFLLLPRRRPCRRTPPTCAAAASSLSACPVAVRSGRGERCASSETGEEAGNSLQDGCECSRPRLRPSGAPSACTDCIFIPRFHVYEKVYPAGYKIEELGPVKFGSGKELGDIGKSDMV